MINSIGIALSGLNSASQHVNASASNIANALTSGSTDPSKKQAYTPVDITNTAQKDGGVQSRITQRSPAFNLSYSPNSPFADSEGYINTPNVDIAQEIIQMKLASLSYKANAKVLATSEEQINTLLDTFDKKV